MADLNPVLVQSLTLGLAAALAVALAVLRGRHHPPAGSTARQRIEIPAIWID